MNSRKNKWQQAKRQMSQSQTYETSNYRLPPLSNTREQKPELPISGDTTFDMTKTKETPAIASVCPH